MVFIFWLTCSTTWDMITSGVVKLHGITANTTAMLHMTEGDLAQRGTIPEDSS